MSRHRASGSYDHAVSSLGGGDYRLRWTVDRYYVGSRQRYPRSCHRDTDMAGAVKFILRHGVYKMPEELRAACTEAARK